MSVLKILGGIVGAVGKVIGVVGSIIKVARPVLEAIRPAVDEVDQAMDWLEGNVASVGQGTDDFLDRNLQVLIDLEDASARGVVVFGKINELAAHLRVASQENTPDTFDEAEAAKAIKLLGEIKDAIAGWRPAADKALVSLKAAEAELDKAALLPPPADPAGGE